MFTDLGPSAAGLLLVGHVTVVWVRVPIKTVCLSVTGPTLRGRARARYRALARSALRYISSLYPRLAVAGIRTSVHTFIIR